MTGKLRRLGLKAAGIVAIAATIQASVVSVVAAIKNMRPPWFVLVYMILPKHLSWRLFPTRASNPGKAVELPRASGREHALRKSTLVPFAGKRITLRKYMAKTNTKSFVVLHAGKVAGAFGGSTKRYTSWSMAKSITSLAVGTLIAEGKLSYDTTVSEVLPTFAGLGNYDKITVAQLLDMSSGIDMGEHYGIRQRYVGVQGMYMVRSQLEYIRKHTKTYAEPGVEAKYRSVDAAVLGLMVSAASGETLAHVVERAVWRPAGAKRAALWGLDKPGGSEQAFCSCNGTAEDYARVGLWLLTDPPKLAKYLERIRHARDIEPLQPGWRYSSLWWHPPGSTRYQFGLPHARGDYTACGWRGQYLWIDPETETVIVRFADDPASADSDAHIAVFRSLADGL